ncbi:hypothetical protein BDK61_1600 [Haloarcula quadrata]|uniref:Uncharacterized protein n=2 Tax=Haloarcula TaxID=2237 RepID=A0A495R5Z4_9EURY|nr:hypothetical protein BDK61_1600 [Haloarcula quadrata]
MPRPVAKMFRRRRAVGRWLLYGYFGQQFEPTSAVADGFRSSWGLSLSENGALGLFTN